MDKKRSFVFAGIAVVIVAITIVLVVALIPQTPKDEVIPPSSGDAAVQSLNQVLEFPKTVIPGEETPQILTLIEDRNGYALLSFEIEGDIAIGTFKVYCPDVYSVAKKIDSTMTNATKSELNAEILKELTNAQIIEKEISLEFEIIDGEYHPLLTTDFLDAYYGGVYQLREEILGE